MAQLSSPTSSRELWLCTLTLNEIDQSGTPVAYTLRLSDKWVEFDGEQYAALVGEWGPIVSGMGDPSGVRYSHATTTVRVLYGARGAEQGFDETVFDLSNTYELQGARCVIERVDLTATTPAAEVRFDGIVIDITDISRSGATLDCVAELATEPDITQIHAEHLFPDGRASDYEMASPYVVGRAGIDKETLRQAWPKYDDTDNLDNDALLSLIIRGDVVPVPMSDATGSGASAEALRFLVHGADGVSPTSSPGIGLNPLLFSLRGARELFAFDGTVTAPTHNGFSAISADIETDETVNLRGFHTPETDTDDHVTPRTDTLADIGLAFDRAVHTGTPLNDTTFVIKVAAGAGAFDVGYGGNGAAWLSPTIPSGIVIGDVSTAASTQYLCALFFYAGSSTVTNGIELQVSERTGASPVTEEETFDLKPGLNAVRMALGSTMISRVIKDEGTNYWGNAADDFIQVALVEGLGTDFEEVTIIRFGFSILWPMAAWVLQASRFSRWSDLAKQPFEDRSLVFNPFEIHGGIDSALAELDRVAAALRLAEENKLTDTISGGVSVGCFYGGASNATSVASTLVKNIILEMETGATFASGLEIWDDEFINIRDASGSLTPEAALNTICNELFVRIWRRRDGVWDIRRFDIEHLTDFVIPSLELSRTDIVAPLDGIRISITSCPEIVNAGTIRGGHSNCRYHMWIDESTFRISADAEGNRDTAREAVADASQAKWGRKHATCPASIIPGARTAWSVLTRKFDYHAEARVHAQFLTGNIGYDLDECEVFTTNANLDDVQPFAGPFIASYEGAAGSWGSKKWLTKRITEKPYNAVLVEAVLIG